MKQNENSRVRVILIYRRVEQEQKMAIRARWEDGQFVNDPTGVADRLTDPSKYDAEGILQRFSGPKYFAVPESEAPLRYSETRYGEDNTGEDEAMLGEFMRQKLRRVEEYQNGIITEQDYSDEEWAQIKEWVEKYG